MVHPGSRPVRKSTVEFRILDDLSGVAVDSATGEAHALNTVATAVLERCDGTLMIEKIVDEVAEIFDAPRERIAADVEGFLNDLDTRGLIEW
jgi:pyrroloquinoline quinone biosynthesis protein D